MLDICSLITLRKSRGSLCTTRLDRPLMRMNKISTSSSPKSPMPVPNGVKLPWSLTATAMKVTLHIFCWVHTVPPLTLSSYEDMLCTAAGSLIGELKSEMTLSVVLTVCQRYYIECVRDVMLALSVLHSFGSGKIEKINVCWCASCIGLLYPCCYSKTRGCCVHW